MSSTDSEMLAMGVIMVVIGLFIVVFGTIYTVRVGDIMYTQVFSYTHPVWAPIKLRGGSITENFTLNIVGVFAILIGVFALFKSGLLASHR